MEDDSQHTREIFEVKKRRLQMLELKAAQYGLECPTSIAWEIQDLREEVDTLGKLLQLISTTPNIQVVTLSSAVEVVDSNIDIMQ